VKALIPSSGLKIKSSKQPEMKQRYCKILVSSYLFELFLDNEDGCNIFLRIASEFLPS
jgi:hypothetical protein